jgi:hypothetical protein
VSEEQLDPRWEWFEVTAVGDRERHYVKGMCRHVETVPVRSAVTGETLARLCLTCDAQFNAPWVTDTDAGALPAPG